MTLSGIFFIIFYFIIFGYTIDKISRGKIEYLIIYICTCLPIYTTLQAQVFKIFNTEIVVTIIKLSKDIIFFYAFIIFLFRKNIHLFKRIFKFSLVDKLILIFTLIVTIYALIPLGEADIFSKLIYAKNLYIISITYLIGRNIKTDPGDCVIFHANLWHTATPTNGIKRAIHFSFGTDNKHSKNFVNYYLKYRTDIIDNKDEIQMDENFLNLLKENKIFYPIPIEKIHIPGVFNERKK